MTAGRLNAETAAANARFRAIYGPWKALHAGQVLWFRVVENTFDNFMVRASTPDRL